MRPTRALPRTRAAERWAAVGVACAAVGVACAALAMLAVGARADAPSGHFIDLGDGTVQDSKTRLLWQQEVVGGGNRAAMLEYCSTLSLAGRGWRVPSVLELRSLVDETHTNPSIDARAFPLTPQEAFWSSTLVAGHPDRGWYVNFAFGYAASNSVDDGYHVRCVR